MIKPKEGIGESAIKSSDEELKRIKTQANLKKKYKIYDDNTFVVEKKSLTKFLIQALSNLIRLVVILVIICLATIGLLTLAYEKPRTELFVIFSEIIKYFKG